MSALRIALLAALAWLTGPTDAIASANCSQPAQVCATAIADALALIDAGQPAVILADSNDFPGVLRAAGDLRTDLSAVAGHAAVLSTESMSQQQPTAVAILIGTLGRTALLASARSTCAAWKVAGKPTCCRWSSIPNPESTAHC